MMSKPPPNTERRKIMTITAAETVEIMAVVEMVETMAEAAAEEEEKGNGKEVSQYTDQIDLPEREAHPHPNGDPSPQFYNGEHRDGEKVPVFFQHGA